MTDHEQSLHKPLLNRQEVDAEVIRFEPLEVMNILGNIEPIALRRQTPFTVQDLLDGLAQMIEDHPGMEQAPIAVFDNAMGDLRLFNRIYAIDKRHKHPDDDEDHGTFVMMLEIGPDETESRRALDSASSMLDLLQNSPLGPGMVIPVGAMNVGDLLGNIFGQGDKPIFIDLDENDDVTPEATKSSESSQ